MPSANRTGMKADISGLIADWGKRCIVSRLSATITASKRASGSFVNTSSGTFWIQPLTGDSRRSDLGLSDKTTHMMVARLTASLKAEDRISPSGESYLYDVVSLDEHPTHYEVQLQRLKRS